MDRFHYEGGRLFCEDVPVADLAGDYGTPLYVYSAGTLRDHYRKVRDAFAPVGAMVCYSVKSLWNLHVLRLLAEEGAGFDVVSGGELYRAIQAGGDPSRCCFAGVGKTDAEIRYALQQGLGQFSVESEAELENLGRLAAEAGVRARAALRVNPDVDPHTHRHMTTGKKETKFGIDLERAEGVYRDFRASAASDHVRLDAVDMHIGSQITTVQPYVDAVTKVLDMVDRLRAAGCDITRFDLGGGFGVRYEADEALEARAFGDALVPLLAEAGVEVVIEPGRFISGNAGVFLTEVKYVKRGGRKTFVICDAGFTQLMRPALYDSYHHIWPVEPGAAFEPRTRTRDEAFDGLRTVDVVGPVCESTDFFAKDRPLPPVGRGELLAIFTAGAYGMVMASEYNAFPRPAEVLVEGDGARLIRRRGTYEDLVAPEKDVPGGWAVT